MAKQNCFRGLISRKGFNFWANLAPRDDLRDEIVGVVGARRKGTEVGRCTERSRFAEGSKLLSQVWAIRSKSARVRLNKHPRQRRRTRYRVP